MLLEPELMADPYAVLSELPSNNSGTITGTRKEFQWDSYSASCKIAGTCPIDTISGT